MVCYDYSLEVLLGFGHSSCRSYARVEEAWRAANSAIANECYGAGGHGV